MIKVTRLNAVTSWSRALNAARRTVGKSDIKKRTFRLMESKNVIGRTFSIRLVEYEWTWEQIPQWVTVHFVRHHIGCEKFVHTQRPDRTGSQIPRGEHLQGELNEMDMTANAQEIMAISRVRLCNCASKETREAWTSMLQELKKIDPVLVSKCVPTCVYRGFCPRTLNVADMPILINSMKLLKKYRKTE